MKYFFSDVYDSADPRDSLDVHTVIQNLSARWAWHAILGTHPSKPDAALLVQPGIQDVIKVVQALSVPINLPPDEVIVLMQQQQNYVQRLTDDETFLQSEVTRKLWDRYACTQRAVPAEIAAMPVEEAYETIVLQHSRFAKLLNNRCASVPELFELASHAISNHGFGIVNIMSGSVNRASVPEIARWDGLLSVEDALRMSIIRDRQLCMRLINAPLLVEASHMHDAVLLDALNAVSQRAVVRVHVGKQTVQRFFHITHLKLPVAFPFMLHFFPKLSSRFVWASNLAGVKELPEGKARNSNHNILRIHNSIDEDINGIWPLLDSYNRVILKDPTGVRPPALRAASVYYIQDSETDSYAKSLVRTPEMQKALWNAHVSHSCPLRAPDSTSPADGLLLFHRFLAKYVDARSDTIDARAAAPLADNAVGTVFVCDGRKSVLSLMAAVVTLTNLEHKWNLTIATPPTNVEFYRSLLPAAWHRGTRFIELENYPNEKFCVETYSSLLKSTDFWAQIPEKHCLVVQDDGMIVRPGAERYLACDYVGAPWIRHETNALLLTEANPLLVGNGGVSLRSSRVMQAICQDHETNSRELFASFPQVLPEDVFFARFAFSDGYKLCSETEAAKFAVEQVMTDLPLGFHKPWAYHHPKSVQGLFDRLMKA